MPILLHVPFNHIPCSVDGVNDRCRKGSFLEVDEVLCFVMVQSMSRHLMLTSKSVLTNLLDMLNGRCPDNYGVSVFTRWN